MRKKYGVKFKSKVALEAIKNDKTIAELSNKYEIHRDLVQKWKKTVVEGSSGLFSTTKSRGVKPYSMKKRSIHPYDLEKIQKN